MAERVKYPAEFVAMVNDEFANDELYKRMSPLLEEGSLMPLGQLLHEARLFDGSARRIHDMLYTGQARELQRQAAIAERREVIYAAWYALYEDARCVDTAPSPTYDDRASDCSTD